MVCDFCAEHLEANKDAFADPRLQLVIDDARAQLEQAKDKFDVIIGDLADPVFGGPCYQVCWSLFRRLWLGTMLKYRHCAGLMCETISHILHHTNRIPAQGFITTCWPVQLYTQEFYRTVICTKLAPGGIFVTQSGPAGVLTCTEVLVHPNSFKCIDMDFLIQLACSSSGTMCTVYAHAHDDNFRRTFSQSAESCSCQQLSP